MDKKRLKRALGVAIPFAVFIISISYNSYVNMYTFTLSGEEIMKSEQIQLVNGSIKVTDTFDTNVVFTDVETGETYTIGYITSGIADTIQLEREKWYKVQGCGNLTVRPVNTRIE